MFKPAHPNALLVDRSGKEPAYDRWLSLLYNWLTATIDSILDAFATTEFITASPSDALGAERVTTSSSSITVDTSTPGQIEWDLNVEFVQDLVGTMGADTTTIDFSYDDATGTITMSVVNGSINLLKLSGDSLAYAARHG